MIRLLILATVLSTLLACSWQRVPTNIPSVQERDKAHRTVAKFTDIEQLTPMGWKQSQTAASAQA